jgi:hypothetical protein
VQRIVDDHRRHARFAVCVGNAGRKRIVFAQVRQAVVVDDDVEPVDPFFVLEAGGREIGPAAGFVVNRPFDENPLAQPLRDNLFLRFEVVPPATRDKQGSNGPDGSIRKSRATNQQDEE